MGFNMFGLDCIPSNIVAATQANLTIEQLSSPPPTDFKETGFEGKAEFVKWSN